MKNFLKIKIGDTVRLHNPGNPYHNKIGKIRYITYRFGKETPSNYDFLGFEEDELARWYRFRFIPETINILDL